MHEHNWWREGFEHNWVHESRSIIPCSLQQLTQPGWEVLGSFDSMSAAISHTKALTAADHHRSHLRLIDSDNDEVFSYFDLESGVVFPSALIGT